MVTAANATRVDTLAGSLVAGRYEVRNLLGAGTRGTVLAAWDRVRFEEVALKLLKPPSAGNAAAGRAISGTASLLDQWHWRMRREFFVMAELRHPILVPIYDFGQEREQPFFTMAQVAGRDLSDGAGILTPDEVSWILAELCSVLATLHARGYAHRRLSPSRLRLVSQSSNLSAETRPRGRTLSRLAQTQLLDLGLLSPLGAPPGEGARVAWSPYHAPESAVGEPVHPRVDLFALGVLGFFLLSGQFPYDREATRVAGRKPPRPADLVAHNPDVPSELAALLNDLVNMRPAARPSSAREVLERLGAAGRDILLKLEDSGPALRAPELVGRTAELDNLREALDEAAEGQPSARFILGPPGVGKTRLLEDFLVEARVAGAWVAHATASDAVQVPYGVLGEALRPLMEEAAVLAPGSVTRHQDALSPVLLGLDADGGADDAAALRANVCRGLAELLAELGQMRPAILVLDELQHSDLASVEALIDVSAALGATAAQRSRSGVESTSEPTPSATERDPAGSLPTRVLILGAARSDDNSAPGPGKALAARLRRPHIALELGPLGAPAVVELTRSLFSTTQVPERLGAQLHVAAQGNPRFTLELLRELVDRQEIVRQGGRWQLPEELPGAGLPVSLASALDERCDRLSPEALALAQAVAVWDDEVELDWLASMLAVERDAVGSSPAAGLLAALDELVRRQLLVEHDGRYRFEQPKLREGIYARTPPDTRQALHRAAARLLTRQGHLTPPDRDAAVGQQLVRGGPSTELQGARLLARAGEAYFRGHAIPDAARLLRIAGSIFEDRGGPGEHQELCMVWDLLGRTGVHCDLPEAISALTKLRTELATRSPLKQLRSLRKLVGPRLALAGSVAIDYAGRRLRGEEGGLEKSVGIVERYFVATAYLANMVAFAGRPGEGIELSEELSALVAAVAGARKVPEGTQLLALASSLLHQGRMPELAQSLDDAQACFDSDHVTPLDPFDRKMALGTCANHRAWMYVLSGDRRMAASVEELAQVAERIGSEFWRMHSHLLAAKMHSIRGEVDRCVAERDIYVEICRRLHPGWHEFFAYPWTTPSLIEAGRYDEADAALVQLDQLAPEGFFRDGVGVSVKGQLALARGDLGQALEHFSAALVLAQRSDVASTILAAAALLGIAEVRLGLRAPGEALTLARQALSMASTPSTQNALTAARARRMAGRALVALDDPYAVAALAAAAAAADRLGNPIERALTALSEAEAASRRQQRDAARAHAERALGIFAELGNQRRAAEAQAVLSRHA